MSWEYLLRGFSQMRRQRLKKVDEPFTVSKEVSASEEWATDYEIAGAPAPIVGPWRISESSGEFVEQRFLMETDKIVVTGDYATTTKSSGVGSGTLVFGALLYTYDETETHQPWVTSPIVTYTIGDKVQSLTMSHAPAGVPPPTTTLGSNPFTYESYTVKYPGLISQVGFAWWWSITTSTADFDISLEATITGLWMNVTSEHVGAYE